jgi:peptidoglycan/LPS O-acetylase OafA/YrhL
LIIDYIPFFAIGVAAYRVWSGKRRWIQQLPLLALGYISVILDGSWEFICVYALSLACFVAISLNLLSFLKNKILIWLGTISYTLYLVHQNIGYAIMDRLLGYGITSLSAVAFSLPLVITLAWLISRYIERPALNQIRQYWRNRKTLFSPQRAEPASK